MSRQDRERAGQIAPRMEQGHLVEIRDVVLALTPFGRPEPAMVCSAERAGALGLLDLGLDRSRARDALAVTAGCVRSWFGVRIVDQLEVDCGDLPSEVDTVLLAGCDPASMLERWLTWREERLAGELAARLFALVS